MDNLTGQQIDGRYQIISQLGQGGMGAVYRARDLELNREVAIKVMEERLVRQAEFQSRFLQEAQAAAQLKHPNIVQVYDVKRNRLLYIVMEYLAGPNLWQALAERQRAIFPLPLGEALQLARQVSLALAHAHAQGVIHGDLKPENIVLAPEPSPGLPPRPVLTDFGLARLLEQSRQLISQRERLLGTPAYAAPEQIFGQPLTPQSDIYSLGVVLYLLAVGRLPFEISTIAEAIHQHRRGEAPPAPRSSRPDFPASIESVIMRALALDPAQRFATAAELATAIERVLPDAAGLAVQPPGLAESEPTPEEAEPLFVSAAPLSLGESAPQYGRTVVPAAAAQNEAPTPVDETPPPRQRPLSNAYPAGPGLSAAGGYGPYDQQADTSEEVIEYEPPGLLLDQTSLTVEAGDSVTLMATIANLSHRVDGFTLEVKGIPESWIQDLPAPMQLFPEGVGQSSAKVSLTIAPPRNPQSKAKTYQVTVMATSQNDSSQFTELSLPLTVAPFIEFSTDLWPDRVRAGQPARVTITNKGNAPQTFTVRGRDRAEEVNFEPLEKQVTVVEGQPVVVDFRARPRQRHWLGPPKYYPFFLQVAPPEGTVQELDGELVSQRLLSWWMALVPLLLLCLGASGLALVRGGIIGAEPTATLVAATEVPPPPTPAPITPTVTLEFAVAAVTTPVPALRFTADDKQIFLGEQTTLRWQAIGFDSLTLSSSVAITPENVLMQSFRVVSPTTSVTYTLVGSATTLTKAITESLRIEVLRRKSLAFTGLGPNQMLDGTELEKQGVEFSIAEKDITDETCVAQIKKIKPAVVTAGHGWQGPYLTTFVPPVFTCPGECGEDCECQKVCKSVPLSINFLKEPTRVTLTLLNPTNSLKAFEVGATDPLPDSTNLNFRQTATFKSDKGIDRVVVGIDKKQPPAVVQIYYEYVVEEDDDTMAMH